MIEYRIHNTETGEDNTGTAESVMLFANGIETTNDGPKQGTKMAGYFGRRSGVIGMAEALKRSALRTDGLPFRSFITSVKGFTSDRNFQKQSMELFLGDAMKAMGKLADMAGAKMEKMEEDINE